MTNKVPRVAVRAIILDKSNKVLLIRRSNTEYRNDDWCLPGGKIEVGETAEKAMVKEVKEETNLDCDSTKFLFYQDNLPNNIDLVHFISLYFECKVSGEIELNPESSEFCWVDITELDSYNIAFNNDKALHTFWKI